MKKIVFLLCLWLSFSAEAQTFKQYFNAAEKAFAKEEYNLALAYYQEALLFKQDKNYIYYKIAKAYYHNKAYGKALSYFSRIKNTKAFDFYHFYYAKTLHFKGKYDQAIKQYQQFQAVYTTKDFYSEKTAQSIASCYWAKDHFDIQPFYEVKNFNEKVNTPYSEFAMGKFQNDLWQVSRFAPKPNDKSKQQVADIEVFLVKEKVFEPKDLSINIPKEKEMANGFYVKEKDRFYFSLCNAEQQGKKHCDLYVSEYKNKKWQEIKKLNINQLNASSTQACVYVNNEGKDVLYFVSDRSGGVGQKDIYTSTEIEFGIFDSAQILPSNINTIGNEVSPFYDKENNVLYFSSDYHYGYGAQDIFKIDFKEKRPKVQNLGMPHNSTADDLYYRIVNTDTATFSSNREEANKLDKIVCCYDVFEVVYQRKLAEEYQDSLQNYIKQQLIAKEKEQIDKIQQMLPLQVYFHNDEPNPKSSDTTTHLAYNTCYESYKTLAKEYAKESQEAEAVDVFYKNSIDKGMQDLEYFVQLLQAVDKAKPIVIQLKAYCSPLAENEYNNALAKRRIVSLQNYFQQQKTLALHNIKFETIAFGEEKANSNVSDSYYNKQASIYSVAAMQERKVEIIGIVLQN